MWPGIRLKQGMSNTTTFDIDPTETLADLAIRLPGASRVFHRHRLDFCCGGRRSLAEACVARGLEPGALVAELTREVARPADVDWSRRPLGELVDHIVTRFHEPLRAEVPELIAMARKVERVHAEKPDVPRGLADHLADVFEELELHMMKEEQVLFPMVRAGHGAHAAAPVSVMEREHDEHAVALRRTRELTGDLVAPPHACTTWRALYLRLDALERELMEHIHLENNVLFPRALER
jgi:regulator of cell morphogenesis and NO signaling